MDTVWIKLTTIIEIKNATLAIDDDHEEVFMFGPTGITRFASSHTHPHITQLFNSYGKMVAEVTEDSAYIMEVLQKIRKTGGALGKNKQNKKASKRSTSSSKKKI